MVQHPSAIASSINAHHTAPPQAEMDIQHLEQCSLETLFNILRDTSVPAVDRAAIALQVLELTQGTGKIVRDRENGAVRSRTTLASADQIIPFPGSSAVESAIDSLHSTMPTFNIFYSKESPQDNLLPIHFVQIENFLSQAELTEALSITAQKQEYFESSVVHNKKQEEIEKYRRSSILHHQHYQEFSDRFRQKVLATLPAVLKSLERPSFEVLSTVIQLTAHNDGCFYSLHSDANTDATKTREMTYVYYFYREPKGFSGGELKLYETGVDGDALYKKNRVETVEPINNSIIFFPSRLLHEVMPVRCPSQAFEQSRFTFNGWIRRKT